MIVPGRQIEQFLLDAAHVAHPQHGAPANGAALCLYWPSGTGRKCQYETAAVTTQIVHRLFNTACGDCFQPSAECKHPFGDAARGYDADVAEYFRVLGVGGPSHQYLRFRQEECLEAMDVRRPSPN